MYTVEAFIYPHCQIIKTKRRCTFSTLSNSRLTKTGRSDAKVIISFYAHPHNLVSLSQQVDIPIIMSRYFSLIALVLLMASWGSCGKEQRLFWAIRLHPGTRDYLCSGGTKPQCCDHGKYQDIDDRNRIKVIPAGKIPGCQAGGQ
ncbi:hypothetical protein Pst134EA_032071 [Puccinia striiformis f. sp. tritici]|uniref:uncharacterized protein n=1 Tax=Puccinia striiformis f. sp. tritici TaxID=168172 RepID=UPI0020075672|nr:uncharacterized protein Pst134EA_032071 [Puccinia striiformis f. sp. tritici]KAH9441940.1 hypothetical protein Pst134EA_032071 [Puccinia striiformis f. sp. tritici]